MLQQKKYKCCPKLKNLIPKVYAHACIPIVHIMQYVTIVMNVARIH